MLDPSETVPRLMAPAPPRPRVRVLLSSVAAASVITPVPAPKVVLAVVVGYIERLEVEI